LLIEPIKKPKKRTPEPARNQRIFGFFSYKNTPFLDSRLFHGKAINPSPTAQLLSKYSKRVILGLKSDSVNIFFKIQFDYVSLNSKRHLNSVG